MKYMPNTILTIKCPDWQCGGMVLTIDLEELVKCENSKHLNENLHYVKDYKISKLRKLIYLIASNIEYSNMTLDEVYRYLALNRSVFAEELRLSYMLEKDFII